MTISIPVTSNATKHNADSQCVTRTVAVCRTAPSGTVSEVAEGYDPSCEMCAESAMIQRFDSVVWGFGQHKV